MVSARRQRGGRREMYRCSGGREGKMISSSSEEESKPNRMAIEGVGERGKGERRAEFE